MSTVHNLLGKLVLAGVVLLAALLIPSGAPAGTPEEIDHLLQYTEQSGCVFIRNSKEHDSLAAGEHIRMKYNHVKNRVNTAEDFIEYAATKSSLSGKPYLVRCQGEELPTAEWLRAELARFRQPEKETARESPQSFPAGEPGEGPLENGEKGP